MPPYNNHLVKTCIPYFTNNFLYLLNATKSRKLYDILNTNCEEPTGKVRWNQIFNICDAEWEQIFSLPFRLTKNTKLQWFQFRINHKILSTNSFLQKIKLKDTNICTFCRSETETIEHILWDCEIVQALLDEFVTFCSNKIHWHISFAKKAFILGSCVKKDTVKNPYYLANKILYLSYEMFK